MNNNFDFLRIVLTAEKIIIKNIFRKNREMKGLVQNEKI